MKKRGSTHVGVVLSFVIFVVFLVFLYSALIEPTINQNDKNYLLENLRIKLIENVSGELTSITIDLSNNPNQNCIELGNFITKIEINSNIISKNKNILQSYVNGNNLRIVRESNETFFKIYYSKEFSVLTSGGENCDIISENNYLIGLVRTDKYVFETKIISLINEYKNNYETLKGELKIPIGSDFNFGFTYNNKTSIITEKDISTNIYAVEIPVQYVDKESNILLGSINIKIW